MKKSHELLAAGFGGVVATGFDLALLVFMVGHHVPVPTATFIAALTGAAANFVLNKYVAFRDRSPINLRQLARFQLVSIVTALLMAAAMQLVAVRLGVPVLIAKLGCAAVLFALWSYPAQRRLVFTRSAAA